MNSGFGLWLLSAVFLYGAGAAYAIWHAHADVAQAHQLEVERLDLEISFRFSSILEQLRDRTLLQRQLDQHDRITTELNDNDDDRVPSTSFGEGAVKTVFIYPDAVRARIEEALKSTAPSALIAALPNTQHPCLYPEYERYTIVSLLIALRGREPRPEQVVIDKVIRDLGSTKTERAEDAARQIKTLILPRWRHSFRLYFDCPESDPLCVRRDDPLWDLHLSVHRYGGNRNPILLPR